MSIAGMVALGAAGVPGFSQMFGFRSKGWIGDSQNKITPEDKPVSKYRKGDRIRCKDNRIYEVCDVIFDNKGECYLLKRADKIFKTKIWVRLEFILGV